MAVDYTYDDDGARIDLIAGPGTPSLRLAIFSVPGVFFSLWKRGLKFSPSHGSIVFCFILHRGRGDERGKSKGLQRRLASSEERGLNRAAHRTVSLSLGPKSDGGMSMGRFSSFCKGLLCVMRLQRGDGWVRPV